MRRKISAGAFGLGCTVLVGLSLQVAAGTIPVPLGGPVHPIRTPQGGVLRNIKNQVTTQNWSGYAVTKYETGTSYSSATATWVVPTASVPPGFSAGYSSSWVGIGGFCLNTTCTRVDKTLIQLGTEQTATSSGSKYYAWWETLPQTSQTISSITVNPGDTIVATLQDGPSLKQGKGGGKPGGGGGKGQSWTLTITNTSNSESWSKTLSYNSSLASAEWIEEAPSSGGILPLANYGTATFDPGSANGLNPNLSSANGIVMLNPNGQTSNISLPDSDTDGFATCWGNGTALTSCASPIS